VIGPGTLVAEVTARLGAVSQAGRTIPRVLGLLDAAEVLVRRLAVVIEEIEATNRRAAEVAERTASTQAVAAVVADEAAVIALRIAELVNAYEPELQRLQPVVSETAGRLSSSDPVALATMIDAAPGLMQTMERDVVPILQTLGTLAPDMTDLLDTSRTLNEMLGAVPGLGRIKKRMDDDDDD
jgi:hypothetical protein